MGESGTDGRNGGGADAAALPRWVWWLTIGWLAVLVALVAASEPCDALASYWRPDSRYLACLQANEIGDFLAGAFAPLAFLWLIATVVIQARELRAQRQELQLTRREFQANRKVAEAQATEAKRQAEFIGTQTDILREDQIKKDAAAADDEYDALLAAIATLRRRLSGRLIEVTTPNGARHSYGFSRIEAQHDLTDASYLIDVIAKMGALDGIEQAKVSGVSRSFVQAFDLLEEALSVLPRCSRARQIQGTSVALPEAAAVASTLQRLGLCRDVE